MTAGPTPLPPAVSQAMAEPMLYHRAPAFVEVYERVLGRLREVFGTAGEVLVFASSGTGAMESAVANLVRSGEPALVASCGKFGERWVELCDAYGARTIHWETEWGRQVDPAERRHATRRERRGRARVRHAVRDVDRRRERRARARRGGPSSRRADRGRRGVRHGRGALPAGRVGARRGGGGLPEGADGAAGARLREPERGGPRAGGGQAGRALLPRLGPHRRRPAERSAGQPLHARRRPRTGARRGARDDRLRGPRPGLPPPRAARAGHARRRQGARPRAARGRARERERSDRDRVARGRSTAPACRS